MNPKEAWTDFIREMESRADGKFPTTARDDTGARAIFLAGFVAGMDYLIGHLAETSTQHRRMALAEITQTIHGFEESAHKA